MLNRFSRIFSSLPILWVLLLLLTLGMSQRVQATHLRAGNITAKNLNGNPLSFEFTLTVYTFIGQLQETEAILNFGDGTRDTAHFVQQTNLPQYNAVETIFKFYHIYGAQGVYKVSYTGINRNQNIQNIQNSVNQTMFLETELVINPIIGPNQTPTLTFAPLDNAVSRQIFEHNPGAIDADGDSIAFKIVTPKQNNNNSFPPNPGPVNGYSDPTAVGAPPVVLNAAGTGPATFTMDVVTGDLIWDAPKTLGPYNVAFVIEEWRRIQATGARVRISVITRDMQIDVRPDPNRRPIIDLPNNLCLLPGTVFQDTVKVSDPDNDPVTLTMSSPFSNKTTLTAIPGKPNQYLFKWDMPECVNVRQLPYLFVFRAEDHPTNSFGTLVNFETWQIRVVGPPPTGLTVVPQGTQMQLSWNAYTCPNADQMAIWRKADSTGFVPDSCETGVPVSTGYQRIGIVPINQLTFTDTDNLKRGVQYCYLIDALYSVPAPNESYASTEECARLKLDVPLLTHVTVTQTDAANGSIVVRWVPPVDSGQVPNPDNLVQLYRKTLGVSDAAFTQIFSGAIPADTLFTDQGLNTLDSQFVYRLDFQPLQTVPAVEAARASSVFLTTESVGKGAIQLTWKYEVPWDNSNRIHSIYRKIGSTFQLIDTVRVTSDSLGQYTDRGTYQNIPLVERETYCYYVTTEGGYPLPELPQLLLNNSQQSCELLKDETPPCPVTLSLAPVDCENFTQTLPYQNQLSWVFNVTGDCDTTDVAYFNVYFIETEGGQFDSISFTKDKFFTHAGLSSLAGCYQVTAVDSSGNESPRSNTVCQDNCIFFELPNIITPNHDGKNDVFRPTNESRFVKQFKARIFNRWGNLVFESKGDQLFEGKNHSGIPVPEGIYYYQADVEFFRLNPDNSTSTYKGWLEVVK